MIIHSIQCILTAMIKFINKLFYWNDSLSLMFSSLFMQAVSVLTTVIIVKNMSIYSYGEYSFYVVISNLFGQFGALKIESAIIKEDRSEKELLLVCVVFYVIMSVFVFFVLSLYDYFLPITYIDINLVLVSVNAGFFIMVSQYFFLQQGKRGDVKLIIVSRIVQSTLYFSLLFAFREKLTHKICLLIFMLAYMVSVFPYLKTRLKSSSKKLIKVVKENIVVIKYGMINSGVDSVENFFFFVMLASVLGYEGLGSFRLAYVVMRSAVGLVSAGVSTPLVNALRKRNQNVLNVEFIFVFCLLIMVLAGCFVCLLLYRVDYLYAYKESLLYFANLLPWMFGLMLVSPISLVPILYNLQHKQLLFSIGYSVILFCSYFISLIYIKANWVLVPSICLMVYLFFCYFWYRKVIKYELSRNQ